MNLSSRARKQAVSSATTTPQKGVPTFEVDKPSQHHLLEQPILGDNEVLISPEQLKELASLLDNPVRFNRTLRLINMKWITQTASVLHNAYTTLLTDSDL